MILVVGSIEIAEEHIEAAMRLSLEHVHRSRLEPGCLSHEVSVDVENACRLVFVERWKDKSALAVHFSVPASSQFIRAVSQIATCPPELTVYDSEVVSMG